jgi:nucleotide-binding universal stress UspA family protein
MFRRLLVPLDGSHLAEAALPAAAMIAHPLKATVTLAHLIERDAPQAVHGERHLRTTEEATSYLGEIAQRFFGKEIDVTLHVHAVAVRDVARGIAEHAKEFQADLIVMCTHGKRGWRRLVLGSIAQQVLSAGHCPVLLLQPSDAGAAAPTAFRRILVALDGDPDHERSLPIAAGLAKGLGAALHLLTVVPTLGTVQGAEAATGIMLPAATAEVLDLTEDAARAHLAELARGLAAHAIAVTCTTARGDPDSRIVEEAAREQADVIVLGTHGKAGMNAFWSGSVAPHIPSKTHLPLLLIPVHDGSREEA